LVVFIGLSGAAFAQTVRVVVDGASIWSAPSSPSVVLATVKVGTMLDVIGQIGSWYRVTLPSDPKRSGYILVRQVEAGSGTIRVPPSAPVTAAQRPPVRPRKPPRRGYVSAGAGYQPELLKFSAKDTFTENQEQGSRTTSYTTRRVPLADFSGGYEVHRGLFVGAAVSRSSGSADGQIDEQSPHPFFFNQPRTLKASVTDLPRDEIALHIQAGSLVPMSRHVHLFVAAGPTMFKLRETFVTGVNYAQDYPYDTITFQNALTAQQEKTRVGINAQADVVAMFSRHVGVDGFVRFSYASLKFAASDGSTFAVQAGGVHVGISLRAEF
jgi:hypothetical protein